MRELSPRAGRALDAILRFGPRRFLWTEHGRIGLDPHGAILFCARWRGRRVEIAYAAR